MGIMVTGSYDNHFDAKYGCVYNWYLGVALWVTYKYITNMIMISIMEIYGGGGTHWPPLILEIYAISNGLEIRGLNKYIYMLLNKDWLGGSETCLKYGGTIFRDWVWGTKLHSTLNQYWV